MGAAPDGNDTKGMSNGNSIPAPPRGWVHRLVSAQGIFGRALQSSIVVSGAYSASQVLRLASNLVLARVLFPEAFGLMALVTVVMVGLQMLSDVGVGPSISQHARGDDPAFLNTAYTINVVRGAILWVLSCLVAYPMSVFYEAPPLAQLVPAAGLGLLIAGFVPTRVETAHRHLRLVRVTLLDLAANFIAVISMVILAVITRSVWSLVIGQIIGHLAKIFLITTQLPGHKNRFAWDRQAGKDLIGFGKWIFLSTLCAFLLMQGDKMILGAYLTLGDLGIYNIGFFLASFPVLMAGAVTGRVMIPLYREQPASGHAAHVHRRRIRKLRFLLTGSILLLLGGLSLFGVPIIDLLYGQRYAQAGAIVVLVACVQMVAALGMTYDQAALAAGDSRGQFFVMALRAAVQTAGILVGIRLAGLYGALAGQAAALLLLHGALAMLARKHKAWDPLHDLVYLCSAVSLATLAIWVNRAALGF
jgi:O-antigen/teichoic acid export membrane protein